MFQYLGNINIYAERKYIWWMSVNVSNNIFTKCITIKCLRRIVGLGYNQDSQWYENTKHLWGNRKAKPIYDDVKINWMVKLSIKVVPLCKIKCVK